MGGRRALASKRVSADGGLREHARNRRDRCVTQRAGPAPRVTRCVLPPRTLCSAQILAKNIDIRRVREAAAVAGGLGRAAWRAAVRWCRCVVPVQAVRGARRGGAARAAVARSRRPTRVALAHSLRSVHRGLRSRYRHQMPNASKAYVKR